MKNLAITLIEANNSEAPNIGTVVYITDDSNFMDRIKQALEEHFDAEVKSFTVQDGLSVFDVQNSTSPLDAVVVLDNNNNEEGSDIEMKIEIQQTWIY